MIRKSRYTYEPTNKEIRMYQAVSLLLWFHYHRYVKTLPIRETDHLMDYCAGPGIMARELAKRVPKGTVHVVDVSETWLDVSSRRLAEFGQVYCHRLETLDELIGGGGLDKVICHFVLHEFPRKYQGRAVKQLSDNLRNGGELYIREPVSAHHGVGADWLEQMLLDAGIQVLERKEGVATLLGSYVDIRGVRQ